MIFPFPGPLSLHLSQGAPTQTMVWNFHVLPKDQSGRNFMKLLIDQAMYLFPLKSHFYLLAFNGN